MADDYTPSEARVCIDYCNAAIRRKGPGGQRVDIEEADAAFGRFIEAVKRDAAREALDGLAAEAREGIVNRETTWGRGQSIASAAGTYRDTYYPEGEGGAP